MVDDDRYDETRREEYEVDEGRSRGVDERTYVVEEEDEGGWLDEGVISLLLIAGVALFLFPEPGTSVIGLLLIAAGVGGWIVDALN